MFITVLLPDAKNVKMNLELDGLFTFSASAGPENHLFELQLNLRDKVNVEIDWDKWVDEDDGVDDDTNNLSTGLGDLDMGGMDFSNFSNTGGVDELDDYDDDAEEISKPDEEDIEQAESGATHKIEELK